MNIHDATEAAYRNGYNKAVAEMNREKLVSGSCENCNSHDEQIREIIKAADEIIDTICHITGIEITAVGGKYLGLRKKYSEGSNEQR